MQVLLWTLGPEDLETPKPLPSGSLLSSGGRGKQVNK